MDFNPRSPCGERLTVIGDHTCFLQFQSTLPLRGATTADKAVADGNGFQSTLPLRGAT